MNQVRKIMVEHFDSFVVAYKIVDENNRSNIGHDWHGDITDVIGLAAVTHRRIISLTDLPRHG